MAAQEFGLIGIDFATYKFRLVMYKMQHLTADAPLIYYLYVFNRRFLEYHLLLGQLDPVVKRAFEPLELDDIPYAQFLVLKQLYSERRHMLPIFLDRIVDYNPEHCARLQRALSEEPITLAKLHAAMSVFDPCCALIRHRFLYSMKRSINEAVFQNLFQDHPNFSCTWGQLECRSQLMGGPHKNYWGSLWLWSQCDAERVLLQRLADRPNARQRVAKVVAGLLRKSRECGERYHEHGYRWFCTHYLAEAYSAHSVTSLAVVHFLCEELRQQLLFRIEKKDIHTQKLRLLALWLHVRLNQLCADRARGGADNADNAELMSAEEWNTLERTRTNELPEMLEKMYEQMLCAKTTDDQRDDVDEPRLEWHKDAEGRGDEKEEEEVENEDGNLE